MVRLRLPILALASLILAAGTARAQTVTWSGGFPDDNFSTAANWAGGMAPINNGTETLQFTDNSDSTLNLDNTNAAFFGISGQTPSNYGASLDITSGSGFVITLGSGGVTFSISDGAPISLTFDVHVILAAPQTWDLSQIAYGSITVNKRISGPYGLTLNGGFGYGTFAFNSGSSTFAGGVTMTGGYGSLVVGASSTGLPGAITSGPLGKGTLILGDGNTLTTTTGSPITLANAIFMGDLSDNGPVVLGGPSNSYQYNAPSTNLTLTGPVTLNGSNAGQAGINIGSNSTVTFQGDINGLTAGYYLDFAGAGNGNSFAIVQGNITNVSQLQLDNNVSVILEGGGPAQINFISSIGTSANTYLGLGSSYGTSGVVTAFLNFLNPYNAITNPSGSGSAANFQGTLGFDTNAGSPSTAIFNWDPIDLTNFTSGSFVGLGSATTAILGPIAVITPPGGSVGNNYLFGGGGGTLTVQSILTDGAGPRNLNLFPGNAPLTLVLSGTLSYTGSTNVNGAALIFDTTPPAGSLNLTEGYIGATTNSGYTDGIGNIQSFINKFSGLATGVIGFDSLTGQQSIASPIDMFEVDSGLYLGTATSVNYSGTITPYGSQYQFAGVKGGQVTVSSTLGNGEGPNTVAVGLPNPIESFSQANGFMSISSVTLSGVNMYTGGTTLNSGYLYVTNSSSIGTGTLTVPGNNGNTWAATLAASVGAVTLNNPILIPNNGLALNTGSTNLLTLTGAIGDYVNGDATAYGNLGIFGPVDLEGINTYSGGTFINGATVTIGADTGLGTGQVNANNSTLHFTSSAPILNPSDYSQGASFNGSTATFTGSPIIYSLQLAESTLNFNGAAAEISGFPGDSPNSGNAINLGTTVLTINTDDGENGDGGSYHGIITGLTGSLVVTGGGNLELWGANTYGRGTTIEGGTIVVASNNSAFGGGAVTVNGGAIATNVGVTVTNPITLNGTLGNPSGLAGYGTFSPGGNITFGSNSIIDPGSALLGGGSGNGGSQIPVPGKLSFGSGTSLTFGSGGIYLFSISDANGSPGTGFSTVSLGGSLTITNTGSPFVVDIYSFDPTTNLAGPVPSFISSNSYSWTLLSAASITGFNPSYFLVDPTNFQNSTGVGSFFVSQNGDNLMLNFTPVPEQSTWAMMASGLIALGAAVRRRRR